MKKIYTFLVAIMAAVLLGCQKYESTEVVPAVGEGSALLHIRAGLFEYIPFDTRAKSIEEASTRLSYAIFSMDGEKVLATKSQTKDAAGYGFLNVNLDPGQYVLVTVAHNGLGNCTISSPTEVKFANNKVTDTFSSCDTLTVLEGEQTVQVDLKRRVAMIRLLLEETLPEVVTQLKFYYLGGSSTLDASKGYGSVNSRQTELREVLAAAYTSVGTTYDIYTFPHEERDTLKLTITAFSSSGASVAEREIAKVPVKIGYITQYRGGLVGGGASGLHIVLGIEDEEWTVNDYKI